MNIRAKLMMLVGGTLMLLCLVGLSGYWGTARVAHSVVELDRWGNIDMVMNEGVFQPTIGLAGNLNLYATQPNQTNLEASRLALASVNEGLTEWRSLVADEAPLAAVAGGIAGDLKIFENNLGELKKIAEERQTLVNRFEGLEGDLDSRLEHTMETIVDPTKKRAADAGDLAEVVAWGQIDMVLNEEVIANALKLQAVFYEYRFTGDEGDFKTLQAQQGQLTQGLKGWNALLTNKPSMTAVGQEIAQIADNFNGVIAALHDNYQQTRTIKVETTQTSSKVLEQLNQAMTGTIDPAKEHAMEEAENNKERVILLLLVGIAVSLLAAGSYGIVLANNISGPLKKTVEMLDEMERGHIAKRLNLKNRKDEIGRMANTMDRFADSLQNEVVDSLCRLAKGDLTFEVHPRDEEDLLRGALKKVSEDLNQTFKQIQMVATQLDSGSEQVSDTSQSISQGATEQAAALEEISASMTQILSQSKDSSERATQANVQSESVLKSAEKGNLEMRQMVEAMVNINSAGQDISKIIKTIDEIAFQTNLLALNAAVEAARAGQHGKGFAVVAEEVRNLAARSAKAAQETTLLIESTVSKAAGGTQIAERTASSLTEIVQGITKVDRLIAEISTASTEQVTGISQINEGLVQVDQVTQQSTANSEESAAAAEELSSQAAELRHLLSQFQLHQQVGKKVNRPMVAKAKKEIAWELDPVKSNTAKKSSWSATATDIALDDSEFGRY